MVSSHERACFTRADTTFCLGDRECLHGYDLDRPLGEGSTASVFEAESKEHGAVVLKVVPLWVPFALDSLLTEPATYPRLPAGQHRRL